MSLNSKPMNSSISEERLKEIAKGRQGAEAYIIARELLALRTELAEMRTYSHETVRGLVDHRGKEIVALRAASEGMEKALERLQDCDWVITLPDRMDAVREIARTALEAYRKVKGL